ncbi:MAG: hypothetical protein ACKORJ_05395 [Bacteroidota bacterium]
MKNLLALTFLFSFHGLVAQIPSAEIQLRSAVQAAPEELRGQAKVYGYAADGTLTVLRAGTNELICLADDPAQKGINISCYHTSLEPFMARGRALKQQNKSQQEVFDIRETEVKSGQLKMPTVPATLYVYSADQDKYNAATGEITDGYLRYVVYIPYATAASTGLPLKPGAPGMPWLMDPGTHRAHIMINPPVR